MQRLIKLSVIIISSFFILGCGPNQEEKTYNQFYKFCRSVDPQMSQIIQVFGESQFNSWCSCALDKTEKIVTSVKIEQILTKEVGIIDPDYEKFQYTAIASLGNCIADLT